MRKIRLSEENFVNNDNGFERFCDISLSTLNKHAPSKIKHVRGNEMPFYDKEILSELRQELNNFL